MASNQDRISTDNKASIALLRRLRAGEHVQFVHRVDVCAAPPEVLVADLEPVPGTGLDDDGYGRICYLYHAKKYKNSRGDTSGHRHRAVTGGGGASWHQENRKVVEGSRGGTVCSLSYGFKPDPSAPLDRLGWCMAEYDLAAADEKQDGGALDDSSNYVLCKVYRSPKAKGKSASGSSSSNKKKTAKKRKAGGGDHPEAPPAKSIQQQQPQVQQNTAAYYRYQPEETQEIAVQKTAGPGSSDFNYSIEDINFLVDESMLLRDELEPEQRQRLKQPIIEHEEFTVEWLLRGGPEQPIVEPPPGHGGEFIQMPFGRPVVPAVAQGMLRFAPETIYGQWSGGMTTASMPYTPPTSSLYTGCNSVLQGPDPLLTG